MKKISIMKLSGVILLTCAGLANANLLTNPGFEIQGVDGVGDADGWFQTNPLVVQRVADVNPPGHGDYTLQLGDNDPNWHWGSQVVAATPGVEYTASLELKVAFLEEGEAVFVLIDFLDAGGAGLGGFLSEYNMNDPDYVDFGWVTRSVTAVAPAGTTEIMYRAISHLSGNGSGGAWADNAELVAIPEPATMGLFGLMGGAMLWARKRFRG